MFHCAISIVTEMIDLPLRVNHCQLSDGTFASLAYEKFIYYLTAFVPEAPVADIPPNDASAPGSRNTPNLLIRLEFKQKNGS